MPEPSSELPRLVEKLPAEEEEKEEEEDEEEEVVEVEEEKEGMVVGGSAEGKAGWGAAEELV